jgi:hypothetical protein
MRTKVQFAAFFLVSLAVVPVCAFSAQDHTPSEQSIAALEARARQAQPREQCFLYAELVHQMAELSLRQYAAGDTANANSLLQRIQQLAQKIHLSLAENDKRLKSAQILLSKAAFRLTEMLHSSGFDDRPLVAETLAKVNTAQDEALMQVFKK